MALSDNLRGAIYMNVAMAAFTINDAGMKEVTQTLPLFEAIALRGLLSMAALLAFGLATGAVKLRLGAHDGTAVAIRTVAEIGGTLTFLSALMHMPLANLSAIMQSLPLALTLAAALVFREGIGWRRLSAILVGFCGVLLIIQPGTDGFDRWSVVGLASVACVVLRDLSTRRMSRDVPSATVALWAATGVTAMGLVVTSVSGWVVPRPHELAIVATSSTALIAGYMFSVMVMRVGDIGFVAPFRYTSLIWAILLGWLVFGSLPDTLTLVGAGIVIATGIFTLYRERKLAQGSAVPERQVAPARSAS